MPREQHPLVRGAMRYLADTYDAENRYWPFIPATVDNAPHAPWWNPEGRVGNVKDQLANPRAEVIGYLFEYPSSSSQDQRDMLLQDALAWLDANGNEIEMHELFCYLRLRQSPGLPETAAVDLQDRLEQIAIKLVSNGAIDVVELWPAPARCRRLAGGAAGRTALGRRRLQPGLYHRTPAERRFVASNLDMGRRLPGILARGRTAVGWRDHARSVVEAAGVCTVGEGMTG